MNYLLTTVKCDSLLPFCINLTQNIFPPLNFIVQYYNSFTAHYTHRHLTLYQKLVGMVKGILYMLAVVALDILLYGLFGDWRQVDASERSL
jgi:hypothetical protein